MDGRALGRAPDGSRVVRFRASTPAVDRHGTVIRPEGINTLKFDANPIFLWAHDGYGSMFGGPSVDSIIGRVTGHRKSRDAFDIDVEFAPPEASATADQAFRLVQSGFLSAVSIGFVPLKHHEEEIEGRGVTQIFDEVELLEISLVPIPSNPEAVKIVRMMATATAPKPEDEEWRLARHMFGTDPTALQREAADALLRYGKVLSTINEHRIRQAKTNLEECLSTLEKQQQEAEQHESDPQPPALAADAGAVASALKAAFSKAKRPERVKDAITAAFRKALPK